MTNHISLKVTSKRYIQSHEHYDRTYHPEVIEWSIERLLGGCKKGHISYYTDLAQAYSDWRFVIESHIYSKANFFAYGAYDSNGRREQYVVDTFKLGRTK